LDIGVLGYIGIVQHKEHSPEVLSIPPGTPCIILSVLYWFRYWCEDWRGIGQEPEKTTVMFWSCSTVPIIEPCNTGLGDHYGRQCI